MNTFAWDHNLACLNPSCKSHGKPHPNCLCYGHADGGEVTPFCSENRAHKPGCEFYLAEGGFTSQPEPPPTPQPEPLPTPDVPSINEFEEPTAQQTGPHISEFQNTPNINEFEAPADYDSLSEKAKAIGRGAIQGYLGPLAVPAENILFGDKPEDIEASKTQHPVLYKTGEIGSLIGGGLTRTGIGGLMTVAGSVVPEALPVLGKLGSQALKGAIDMGLYQGSDEVSKALLGEGDHEAPVASALVNIKNAALMGAATGGVFNILGRSGSALLEDTKAGKYFNDFMAGVGSASYRSQHPEEFLSLPQGEGLGIGLPEGADPKTFSKGVDFFDKGIKDLVGSAVKGTVLTAAAGTIKQGSPNEAIALVLLDPTIEKYLNKPLTSATQKYIVPALLKALSNGSPEAVGEAVNYATHVATGTRHIINSIEACFKPVVQQTYDYAVSDKERAKLKQYLEEGGIDKQLINEHQATPAPMPSYADGGIVKEESATVHSNGLASVYPEQVAMLTASKARISNYLNSLRSSEQAPKLAFDQKPKSASKEREFDKVLDLAIKPLRIMESVNKGSLTPEELTHANQLHPEIMNYLRKKMTERITKAQLNEETPKYGVRQAMSLFLGTPLDGTLVPQAIQAAQAGFARTAQPQPAQNKPPKQKANSLTKTSEQSMTSDQARARRSQSLRI